MLQILSEFYMRSDLRFVPYDAMHFKHLRELSLSKIMFSQLHGGKNVGHDPRGFRDKIEKVEGVPGGEEA